ncbi:NADH dehydrogenase (ubiquinone) complex I, assembly factor 6-like isoform X2 [Oscarella lobularis]|uniref:NADH dehydrogenase (ubiquinone) complex I, assembly factor 6-like isoform X2 n=1 Tax=Oscarella lobularis TaxID=121494 RepID=UPI0033135086
MTRVFVRFFSSSTRKVDSSYCLNLVKNHDYEHYLCALLLPSRYRDDVIALRAFNVELAKIRSSITDKTTGKLRIQFWHEAIENVYKLTPPQHPVATSLCRAIERKKLTKRWLANIIEARNENLDDKPYRNLKEVEEYGEKTTSSLFYLTLETMDIANVHADHAASHLGKAEAIVTLLRATPYHSRYRRVFLPQDILLLHSVSHEDVIRGKSSKGVKDVVFDLASQANSHLETAKSLSGKLPQSAKLALLPFVPCEMFLRNIQRLDFDIFDRKLQIRSTTLPASLLWQRIRYYWS